MQKKLILAAAAAGLAAMPMPVAGQVGLVPAAPVISAFGACAAQRRPDEARALLATPIDSRAERRAARRLAMGRSSCVRRGFRFITMRTGEFRGGVAEGLLESDAGAMSRLRAMAASAPVPAQPSTGRALVAAYARCIADADPARAVRLLDLVPASAEERAAFREFGPLLDTCTPEGLTLRLDTFDVRNHIAVRLYELAFPAAASGT